MSSIVLPEKVSVLIKGIQSRKTQYTIDKIIKEHAEDENTFFVYVCHNRKAAANQTLGRISSAFDTIGAFSDMSTYNPDIEFVMLKSNGDDIEGANIVSTPNEVSGFMDDNVNTRGLVILAHPNRFNIRKGESQFMTLIRRISNRPFVSRMMVYIDEADAYDTILETHVDFICANRKVQNCLLFSATWEDSTFFKKRGGIPPERRVELEESVDTSMYWTYDEIQKSGAIIYADDLFKSPNWIVNIIYYISGFRDRIPCLYVYLPAEFDRQSHFNMVNTARQNKWVVGLFNSNIKGFILSGDEPLDLHCNMKNDDLSSDVFIPFDTSKYPEYSEGIKYYREKYNFHNLIITGNSCLSRAVTLQCKGLVFNLGVISENVACGDDLYQADRLKGNIKLYRNEPPMYITSKRAFKTLVARENNSRLCERRNMEKTSTQIIQESKKLANDINLPNGVYRYNIHITNEVLIERTGHTGVYFSANGGATVTRILLEGLGLSAPACRGWKGFRGCKIDSESGRYKSTFTEKGLRVHTLASGKEKVRGIGGVGLLNQEQVGRLIGDDVLPNCAEIRRFPVYKNFMDSTDPDLIICLLTKTEQSHLDKWKI